jgi:hypothetical protein
MAKGITGNSMLNECCESDKPYNLNGRVIQHLKLCLDRERKKVCELGKIVAKFQGMN